MTELGLVPIVMHVPGVPVPQGTHRVSPSGRIYESTKDHGTWRKRMEGIVRTALELVGDPITTPVFVEAEFCMPRPRSHYGTGRNAEVLKDGAPRFCATRPDLDKLTRALGDALVKGGLLHDDSLIVRWELAKYLVHPDLVGVDVKVWRLGQ